MNIRNNKYTLLFLLGTLTLGACTQTEEWDTAAGTGISVTLTDQPLVNVETRATPTELREKAGEKFLKDFKIQVTNTQGSTTYDYPGEGKTIPLTPGSYEVKAFYGENPILALDAPYYEGSAEGTVEVTEGEATPVNISCKVANALLSVRYRNEEKIKEAFSEYGLTVEIGEESVDITDTLESAYFRVGSSPDIYFKAKKQGSGEEIKEQLTSNIPTSFEAADHLILTLWMSPEMKMEISTQVETVTVEETIPEKWLPKPKVTAEGFDNNALTFTESDTPTAKLNLTTASAIQDMKLKLEFQDKQFDYLNGEYQLSNIEDNEKLAALKDTLGIDIPGIGEKGRIIDLSPLLAKMHSNPDGQPVNNTLTIDVQANGRWSSEDQEANLTYKIVCNRPQFSIAVQPENVWSKQFTIDEPTVTAGNADALKEKLVYQYKPKDAADNAWQTCSDGLLQAFATHPTNRNYQVRAFYREGIVSNVVDVELEEPTQLPNSGMEEWYCAGVARSIITYNPWNESNESFWNTNNPYTTRYVSEAPLNAGSEAYNCFPAVSYVAGRNGGKAAELRNTAAGRGNTKFIGHTELDFNKVAGELFIGDIEVVTGGTAAQPSGDHYTIIKGKTFNTRPTALHFYYKYAPYNNDTWKASLELLDEEKNTIITKEITSSESANDFREMTITLDYEEGKAYAKCKYIYVVFSSTIHTGSALPYGKVDYTLWRDGKELFYSDTYIGSVLTIDDISLVYDK